MSDYTPTTDEVRECFPDGPASPRFGKVLRLEFDRWLAAHDAEIRADEREQAAQRVIAYYAEHGDEIGTSLHYGLGDAARGEDTK